MLDDLVLTVADNKQHLGLRLSEWMLKGPTLESSVACGAIAAEELGAARVLYPLVRDHAPLEAGRFRDDRRAARSGLRCLDTPFTSWFQVVAALLVVDGALTTVLEAVELPARHPLAVRTARILDDERFHRAFAAGRVVELGASALSAGKLGQAVDHLLPELLGWFAASSRWTASGPAAERLMMDEPGVLRERWRSGWMPALAAAGVQVRGLEPEPHPVEGIG
jgi:1,2-phenylacetyl-CoA epoxidase catalytic subunit